MLLSDKTIIEHLNSGKIKIAPEFNLTDVRPAGIRLHLGTKLLIPHDHQTVDLSLEDEVQFDEVSLLEKPFILAPGQFILGSPYEKFQVPRNLVCHIEGRSTVARIGLAIHCTSGIIDGNFEEMRSVVLEMKNQGPFNIVLRYKMALAMLSFTQLTTDISQKVQMQYSGQEDTVGPNLKAQKR